MNQPTDDLIHRMYDAYSSQDLERLLAFVTDDVDWPDGELRMHGKDAVRRYWTEQWRRVHTTDVPAAVAALSDTIWVVRVEQTVRDLVGDVVSQGGFVHVLRFAGRLVSRLDIVRL